MADADISITLRDEFAAGASGHYEPHQVLQSSVVVRVDRSLNCRHVFARLVWHTEGRGDRDRGEVAEVDLYQGEIRPNAPLRQDFHFRLPESPWSYAGHYISIIWDVEVSLDVPLSRDPRANKRIILAPREP
jgi:hypothetical protein